MLNFSSYFLGCRVNQAELEKINQELFSKGYIFNKDKPDFIIINSCAVTHKAERQVRQIIYQQTKLHPRAKIYLTGCAATLWNKSLNKFADNVIIVLNSQKQNLIKIVETQNIASLQTRPTTVGAIHELPLHNSIDQRLPRIHALARQGCKPCKQGSDVRGSSALMLSGRYLLKIQDGCHRFCSYCIVPHLRGKPRSKTIKEIVNEINRFTLNDTNGRGGLKCPPQEIILTAVNTEDFGRENKETLTDLLDAVLTQTTIPRISFGSINPWSLTNEFIDYLERRRLATQGDALLNPRLINFFHIPLQSGSDKILKLMNRGYTTKTILQKLNRLHKINPNALIATDIIVGFPGETDEDFQQTIDFIKNSPISKVHIFPFSPRAGTKAYEMAKSAEKIIPEVLKKRLNDLRNLSSLKYETFQKSLLGLTKSALFLEKRVGNYQEALLENNLPIWIRALRTESSETSIKYSPKPRTVPHFCGTGTGVKTKKDLKGEIKEVLIQNFQKGKLYGIIK